MATTRIISGTARGRKLTVPDAGTRPTTDRAREGLFSSLQVRFGFAGQRVLDLFAGTGALGLEAASRGAESVVLVESRSPAMKAIAHNIEVVGHPDVRAVQQKASSYLATAPLGYFTMVLADPPYDLSDDAVNEMVRALLPHLVDGAVIVVERHRDSPNVDWPECCTPTGQKLKKRTFGIARMDMAVYDNPDAADNPDCADEPAPTTAGGHETRRTS